MFALKTHSYRWRAAGGTGVGRFVFAWRLVSDHGWSILEYVELVLRDVAVLCIEERSEERDGGGGGGRRLVNAAGEDAAEEIGGRSK